MTINLSIREPTTFLYDIKGGVEKLFFLPTLVSLGISKGDGRRLEGTGERMRDIEFPKPSFAAFRFPVLFLAYFGFSNPLLLDRPPDMMQKN